MGTYRSSTTPARRPTGIAHRWFILALAATAVAVPSAALATRGQRHHPTPARPATAAAATPTRATPTTRHAAPPQPARSAPNTPRPVPSPSTALFGTGPVRLSVTGFWSWALLDRQTGRLYGFQITGRTTTASMIKAWLAADYLRRAAEQGTQPSASRLAQLSTMIRDSDNAAAETTFRDLGGADSIRRLISRCGLTDSRPTPGYWSLTVVSARDTVRMGACLADGRAAGPRWTGWLLNEMRHVRGFGGFGIRPALPPDLAARTAVKNGWLLRDDGLWYVNCLAIVGDRWVLAVLARYDGHLGVGYGTAICSTVTAQLVTSP